MELLQDMPGYIWGLMAAFLGLSLFLTILWIIVPFSIFGVKPLLKEMLDKLDLLEEHLREIAADKDGGSGKNSMKVMDEEERGDPPKPM